LQAGRPSNINSLSLHVTVAPGCSNGASQLHSLPAILVLLLFVINGMAIWLRKRFERRW
jgi:hypothetical protein